MSILFILAMSVFAKGSDAELITFTRHGFVVIEEHFGEGTKSVVDLVRRPDGETLIWKRPKNGSFLKLISIYKEFWRSPMWRKLGLSTVQVRFAPEFLGVLRTFIPGPTLHELIISGQMQFGNVYWMAAQDFYRRALLSGYHVTDLKARNIAFDGVTFQVIDSSRVTRENNFELLRKMYLLERQKDWEKSGYQSQLDFDLFFEGVYFPTVGASVCGNVFQVAL